MSFLFEIVLLALLSCIGLTHGKEKYLIVDGIAKCESKSPNLKNCAKNNAKILWPKIIKGLKDFGIQSIEPFELKRMEFSHLGSVINGYLKAEGIKVVGLSEMKLASLDIKISNKKLTIKSRVTVPKLKITGSYVGQVKMTLLTVNPRGLFNLVLKDVDVEITSVVKISSRDGHTFGKMTELNVEPKIGDLHLEADELVVSSTLCKTVLKIVHSKWRSYYDSIMPQTRKYWQPYIVELVNKLLDVTPLENAIDL